MNKKYPFKGIVFDLDGTILDSTGIWAQIDKKFFEKRGMKVPEDYDESIAGMSVEESARYTKSRWKIKESPEEIVDEWNESIRSQYFDKIQLKPGAKEFIAMLKGKGVKMGIATALNEELMIACLTRLNVYDSFDAAISVDMINKGGKKTAEVYLAAMKKMELLPQSCLVFEDTLAGVKEALKTGATVYCMSDEASRKLHPEIEKIADSLFENYYELLPGQRRLIVNGPEMGFAAPAID